MRKLMIPVTVFVLGVGTGLGVGRFLPPSAHQRQVAAERVRLFYMPFIYRDISAEPPRPQ